MGSAPGVGVTNKPSNLLSARYVGAIDPKAMTDEETVAYHSLLSKNWLLKVT